MKEVKDNATQWTRSCYLCFHETVEYLFVIGMPIQEWKFDMQEQSSLKILYRYTYYIFFWFQNTITWLLLRIISENPQ